MVVSCQGPAPCSYIGEERESKWLNAEIRGQRNSLPSSLWPVLCSAQPGGPGAAVWEIEHYESNVESFSDERATATVRPGSNISEEEEEQLWAIDSSSDGLCHCVPLPPLMSFGFPELGRKTHEWRNPSIV